MHWWSNKDLLAGKDEQAGGTWLGINKDGRFAAITNLKENNENPSFYIQYAYARISSLKKIAKERKVHLDKSKVEKKQNFLLPGEINIIRCLKIYLILKMHNFLCQ